MAFLHGGRGKGLMDADGIDFPRPERGLHLGKGHFHELHLAGIRAVLIDPRHGHEVNDVIQGVNGDGLSFEILGAFNRRGLQDLDGMRFIRPFDVRGAASDELEIETFHMRLVEGNHIGPADLQIPGRDALHDHRTTRHRNGFQFQAFSFEKAFLHRHEHSGIVDDFHVAQLAFRLGKAKRAQQGQTGNADGDSNDKFTTRDAHATPPRKLLSGGIFAQR